MQSTYVTAESIGSITRSTGVDDLFRPELLNAGDMLQLDNWKNSDGMSIYIDWIPDQLNETNAKDFFSKYGFVKSVNIVAKDKKYSAYLNFINWYYNKDGIIHHDIEAIATAYPGYYNLPIDLHTDKHRKVLRTFQLKCRVNRSTSTTNPNSVVKKMPPVTKKPEERIQFLEDEVASLWKELNKFRIIQRLDSVIKRPY